MQYKTALVRAMYEGGNPNGLNELLPSPLFACIQRQKLALTWPGEPPPACILIEHELGVELPVLPDLQARRRSHLRRRQSLIDVALDYLIRLTQCHEYHSTV